METPFHSKVQFSSLCSYSFPPLRLGIDTFFVFFFTLSFIIAGDAPLRSKLIQMGENIRVSVGGGFVLPTRFGRVELNFSVPILKHSNDQTKMIQLGLGMDYM